MIRKIGIVLGVLVFFSSLGFLVYWWNSSPAGLLSPLGRRSTSGPKPLEKYYFENLRQKDFPGSEIVLEKVIKEEEAYTSWLFSFQTEGKKVTGMANLPLWLRSGQTKFPVIIMLRGYADDAIYFTGLGTRKAAGVFAENGFITLAPDFLGFGGSDTSSVDIIEARLERPVTVLNLLASIKNLPVRQAGLPQADPSTPLRVNPEKVFLWGHSNGGQIALSVLEISRESIPTTLWAPVTKGFPESVLAYMGELDDLGRKVKGAIDQYVKDYDPTKISIDYYWTDIQAPIQVHQGLRDPLVSEEWSDNFIAQLRSLGKEIRYFKYPYGDHNLKSDWDRVVERDLEFFRGYLF